VPITITTAKAVDRREAYVRVIFKPESLQQGEADEEPGAKVGCMPLSPPPASSMCCIFGCNFQGDHVCTCHEIEEKAHGGHWDSHRSCSSRSRAARS
jgi:hypothetical protein